MHEAHSHPRRFLRLKILKTFAWPNIFQPVKAIPPGLAPVVHISAQKPPLPLKKK